MKEFKFLGLTASVVAGGDELQLECEGFGEDDRKIELLVGKRRSFRWCQRWNTEGHCNI